MIGTAHRIEQMEVVLCFDCEDDALVEQGDLGDFVSKKLLAAIDAAFAGQTAPGAVLRIDHLQLDLGRMPYEGFRQEMLRRLRERLGEAVLERAHDHMTTASEAGSEASEPGEDAPAFRWLTHGAVPARADGELLTAEQAELELLLTFLVHGHLPWQAGNASVPELDDILVRVMQRHGADLARLLKAAPHRRTLARRLVRQFHPDAVASVAAFLAAGEPSAARLVAELRASLPLAGGALDASGIAAPVWEALLELVLTPDTLTAIDARLRDLVLQLVPEDRRRGFATAATQLEAEGKGGRRLPALFRSLAKDAPDDSLNVSGQVAALYPELLVSWRQSLAAALQAGDYAVVKPVWRRLVAGSPSTVSGEIRARGRDAAVRRGVAASFTDGALVDIVTLLEPAEAGFISDTVSRPELFREAARLHREEAGDLRRMLWEFTLAFLLEERTSEFNRRSYLGSLLRQMAAHYHLDHRDLLRSLREVLVNSPAPGLMKEEMLDLLRLTEEESYGLPPAGLHGRDNVPDIDLTEEGLRQALSGSRSHSGEGAAAGTEAALFLVRRLGEAFLSGDFGAVARWWGPVVEHRPDLVVAALREKGRGGEVPRKMARGFPIERLVETVALLEPTASEFVFEVAGRPELFREAAGAPPSGTDELARTLWEFTLLYLLADRGSEFNRRSYFGSVVAGFAAHYQVSRGRVIRSLRRVLSGMEASTSLRRDMLLLLDGLADDAVYGLELSGAGEVFPSLSVGDVAPEAARTPSGAGPFEIPAFLDRLECSLSGWGEGSAVLWREMLSRPLAEVRAILQQAAAKGQLRRLAAVLPEKALAAAVARLAPGHEEFMSRLVLRPELFAAEAEPVAELNDLRQDVGEFTLCFLAADRGTVFNRISYLRALLDHMAARQNLDGAAMIRGFLQVLRRLDSADPLKRMLSDFLEETLNQEQAPPGRQIGLLAAEGGEGNETVEVGEVEKAGPEPVSVGVTLNRASVETGESFEGSAKELRSLLFDSDMLGAQFLPSAVDALVARMLELSPGRLKQLLATWSLECSALEKLMAALSAPLLVRLSLLLAGEPGEKPPEDGGVEVREDDAVPQPSPSSAPRSAAEKEDWESPRRRDFEETAQYGRRIYLGNAGLVLAAPYLPQLFGRLNLVKDGKFVDDSCAERAIHLLQFMADGSVAAPEYLLTLNKILCGIDLRGAIARDAGLQEAEKEMAIGLIHGMIANWSAIGKTSVDSFRESFLQREGCLSLEDGQWRLLVESRAYDLLLHRLPWSFSIVKFPWMALPIHVDWYEGL